MISTILNHHPPAFYWIAYFVAALIAAAYAATAVFGAARCSRW
jgi:hypothetical protein